MTRGDAVWIVIGALAVALGAATTFVPAARSASLPRLVAWFLRSWAGRLVLIALWSEAGFHLLCQRP